MGVTRSAVSQTVRKLEETLGIALVHRTTRSVSLTEAGERLYAEMAPAIADMHAAIEAVGKLGSRPRGQLRQAVSSIAERFLSGPLLAAFTEANPEIQLDITVTDEEFDIIAHGYDAGVRLGEVIEEDMIAVAVSGNERQLAVCAPAYLERFGAPSHPRELVAHRCIGWRRAPKVVPYRWEFAEDGAEFSVAVEPEITTNDMALMIKLAIAGPASASAWKRASVPGWSAANWFPCWRSSAPPLPASIFIIQAAATSPPSCVRSWIM